MMGYPFAGRALLAGIIVLAFVALAGVRDVSVLEAGRPDPDARKWHRLHVLRVEGTGCQRRLGIGVTPWQFEQPRGGMLRYALGKWWTIRRDACAELRHLSDPVRAIYAVWGDAGTAAVAVARCESGLSTTARNGQYLGLFQMGDYARSRYGHGWTPLEQARAAHRYYRDAGWHPWTCAHIVGVL